MPDAPNLSPHSHVGSVAVADLLVARERIGELLDVIWVPSHHLDALYRGWNGADLVLPTTLCNSATTPSVELVQEMPGTIWVRNEYSNLHHIGFWAIRGGCPLQLAGRNGNNSPVSFAYHRDNELGVRFEPVDANMRNAAARLFRPDSLEAPPA